MHSKPESKPCVNSVRMWGELGYASLIFCTESPVSFKMRTHFQLVPKLNVKREKLLTIFLSTVFREDVVKLKRILRRMTMVKRGWAYVARLMWKDLGDVRFVVKACIKYTNVDIRWLILGSGLYCLGQQTSSHLFHLYCVEVGFPAFGCIAFPASGSISVGSEASPSQTADTAAAQWGCSSVSLLYLEIHLPQLGLMDWWQVVSIEFVSGSKRGDSGAVWKSVFRKTIDLLVIVH